MLRLSARDYRWTAVPFTADIHTATRFRWHADVSLLPHTSFWHGGQLNAHNFTAYSNTVNARLSLGFITETTRQRTCGEIEIYLMQSWALLHSPGALFPRIEPFIYNGEEESWAPKPISTVWWNSKSLASSPSIYRLSQLGPRCCRGEREPHNEEIRNYKFLLDVTRRWN